MSSEIFYGGGVSDWKFMKDLPKKSAVGASWLGLTEILNGEGVEIQIGFRPPPLKLPIKRNNHSFIGFHQPGERKKRKDTPKILRPFKSIIDRVDILTTMNLAQQVKADYYVLHPYQGYKEGVTQEEKKQKSIKFIKDILIIKKLFGHKYRLCIENLNEPAYPSSVEEAIELLKIFKKDDIGLVFDIDHHWMDFQQKQKNSPKKDYYEQLTKDLSLIVRECGPRAIETFHLAQAYYDSEDNKWVVHGLPGLKKGEKMDNATPLIFSAPENFKGEWLNIGKVIQIIHTLVKENSIDKMKILIEANSEEGEIAKNIKQLKEKDL